MKLKDYLKTAEGEMYIGGESGWFCIGSPKECLELIPLIYETEKERLKTFIKNYSKTDSPNYQRQLKVARRELKELKPILDSQVKEVYEKAIGTGVIVKSVMPGRFWLKKEFEEWKNENLQEL